MILFLEKLEVVSSEEVVYLMEWSGVKAPCHAHVSDES